MIRNEHERRTTQRKLNELTQAVHSKLADPVPDGRDPEMHQLVIDGMRSQMSTLQRELDDYTQLANGRASVTLPNLTNLSDQLIKARIAAGLSQRQLDDAADLAVGTIRRYERDQYQSAPLGRLQLIHDTLLCNFDGDGKADVFYEPGDVDDGSQAKTALETYHSAGQKLLHSFIAGAIGMPNIHHSELKQANVLLFPGHHGGSVTREAVQAAAEELRAISALTDEEIDAVFEGIAEEFDSSSAPTVFDAVD